MLRAANQSLGMVCDIMLRHLGEKNIFTFFERMINRAKNLLWYSCTPKKDTPRLLPQNIHRNYGIIIKKASNIEIWSAGCYRSNYFMWPYVKRTIVNIAFLRIPCCKISCKSAVLFEIRKGDYKSYSINISIKHEFRETCHSVVFIVLVSSHQRWTQTRC